MSPIDEAVRERVRQTWNENFVVVASAGTGKTTLLVDRVVAGVAEGAYTPDNVVLVTYLSKSADELVERLGQRLVEAAAQAAGRQRIRLEHAIQHRTRFRIATLHGFGQQLLTQYAYEANLAPDAEVWDSVEAARQRRQCLTEWLMAPPPAHAQLLTDLARQGLGFEQIQRLLAPLAGVTANQLGALAVPAPSEAMLRDFERRLAVLVQAARAAVTADDPGRLQVEAWHQEVSRQLMAGSPWTDVSLLRWQPGRKLLGNRAGWGKNAQALTDQKRDMKAMQEELTRWQREAATQLMVKLAELARDFEQVFWDWRRERGGIIFADQVDRVLALLRDHPAVRQAVAKSMVALLVDEFQDTAPNQVELVQWLASDPRSVDPDPDRPPPGRLFLVGDPKQSIYRFQGANLRNAMGWVERLVKNGAATELALTANFRSHPSVLAPVNHLFAQLWASGGSSPEDPRYDPLVAHRADEEEARLFYEHEPQASAEAGRHFEAQRTAAVLETACGLPARDRRGGTFSLRFEDMAVLMPSRAGFAALTEALDDAGIPYHAAARGFYAREDVKGIAAVLRAALVPADPVGVLAALRSVWLRVPDAELARHRQGGGSWHPWAVGSTPSPPVAMAFKQLRDWQAAIREWGVATWIEALAISQQELLTDQEAANIRKLVRQAYQYEPLWGYWEFAAWLWERIQQPEDEAEADGAQSGVTITTVHQAKGREWPLVVVAGFSTRQRPDAGVLVDREVGAAVSVGDMKTARWDAVQAAVSAAREAEARRLWYVALTRARDYTVVVDGGRGYPLAADLPRVEWPWLAREADRIGNPAVDQARL